jgi:hypothetical protein
MKFLDRILGRTAQGEPPEGSLAERVDEALAAPLGAPGPSPRVVEGAPPVSLDLLLGELTALLFSCTGERPDPELVGARLADTCRDLDLAPVDPAELQDCAEPLDEEGWTRLWLLALGARTDAIGPSLSAIAAARGARELVLEGFVGVAAATPLLTLELLLTSSLRLEELARRWLSELGATIAGETDETSREALTRLDYARLLAEVDRAKLSAEERVAYLKKLQEEHDAKHPRRGKW